jgi:uncharacterized protein YkwD
MQETMRLHRLRHARLASIFVAILVIFALSSPTGAAAATQGCADDASAVSDLTSGWQADLLSATNAHRTSMGLVALKLDTTLTRASVWKARDMARRNYFSHDDPATANAPSRTPWERLAECGWNTGGSRAENIAAGYASAAATVQAWLDSPGHRANIENGSMRYVGFGVASSSSSTFGRYMVQMFASVAGPSGATPISEPSTDDGSGGDEVRSPQEELDQRALTGITAASRIVRVRCQGSLAVQGWCYRIIVSGRVGSEHAGDRLVVISRRGADSRLVRMAALRTRADGSFSRVLHMRPPARDTATWLRRNATSLRVGVGGTTQAQPAVTWSSARMLLRRG